jgi:hypothetical protein
MVKIVINTEGAAFADAAGNYTNFSVNLEVADILRKLADRLTLVPDAMIGREVPIMDGNGNKVGTFISTKEE